MCVCVFVRMVGSRDLHKESGESEEKEERVIEGEERIVSAEIYCLRSQGFTLQANLESLEFSPINFFRNLINIFYILCISVFSKTRMRNKIYCVGKRTR